MNNTKELVIDSSIATDQEGWVKTLGNVSSSVVTIKFSHARSFDSERALSSEATGFVVDAEKGQVLCFYFYQAVLRS